MSAFKKLKSLFVVDEGDTVKPEVKQSDKDKPKTVTEQNKSDDSSPKTKDGVKGKADQRFTDTLLQAIEANNLEGFDYLEFKEALQNMSRIESDESKCFQAAFITAQTLGVTPSKLVDSAKYYLDILKKEEDKFYHALEQQQAKRITQRQERIEELEKDIKEKTESLKRIQNEIQKEQGEAEKLKKEAEAVTQKINMTKGNFDASLKALRSQLETDIDKMGKYLK